METYRIAVAGTGYVGLSIATLLAQHHEVTAVDVVAEKVDLVNHRKSPIRDEYIERYLAEKPLQLTATLDGAKAYAEADFVVVAAPTNYDVQRNFFDTSAVESVVREVMSVNERAIIIIKKYYPRRLHRAIEPASQLPQPPVLARILREAKPSTTTSIPRASLWDAPKATSIWIKPPAPLPPSFNRAHSSPTSIPSSWAPPKPRP